jgi:hypothetical protein
MDAAARYREQDWKPRALLSIEGAHERVAQSVEHVTFNHGVVGSSPTALTIELKRGREPEPS